MNARMQTNDFFRKKIGARILTYKILLKRLEGMPHPALRERKDRHGEKTHSRLPAKFAGKGATIPLLNTG